MKKNLLFRSRWYISVPRCLLLAMIALSRRSLLDFLDSLSFYMYIYLSFSHAILFYVSPRLSRTRDPSFSPSFFHNFLLVQRTITVVCALGKEGGSERVDGQTVNVWKIGRRTFDFPTRSASPSFSFALPRTVNSSICAYFFFFFFFSFRSAGGRKSIIRECKRRDKRFEEELSPFETMLFYRRIGSISFSRYRLSLAGN